MGLENIKEVGGTKEKEVETGKGSVQVYEYRNLYVLSAAFLAVYTGFFDIQNLQSSLNQEAGLGLISLSCIYVFYIVGGILSSTAINALGEKLILVIAFICHVIYTATNFYPTFATLIPSSVLLGFAAGSLWPAQSTYLTELAYSYAEKTGKNIDATLSIFNGVFFGMYASTQITGNLISSFVLQQGSYGNSTTRGILCGRNECPGATNETNIDEPDRKIVYILLGVFLISEGVGLVLTALFLQSLRKKSSMVLSSICKSLQECGKGMLDVNLVMLIPLFVFIAMMQAIVWSVFTKAYISCPLGIQKIGFVMATYGGSTTLSAVGFSRISRYTGRYFLFGLAGLMKAGLLVTLYIWIPDEGSIVYIFLVAIWYGIPEGILQTESNALTAILFEDKKSSAFAVNQTWKAIGYTMVFAYGKYLCVSIKLVIAFVLLLCAMLLYCVVEIRVKRKSAHVKIENS